MLLTRILSEQKAQPGLPEPQRDAPGNVDTGARGFLWLGGCETGFGAPRVSVVDDGEKVAIAARGIPMWFVAVCLAVPLAAIVAAFLYVGIVNGVCDWRFIPGFVLGPFA